jgi:hypothetical protein
MSPDALNAFHAQPVARVTRLGEFSPIGQLFTLDSFFNYKSSPKRGKIYAFILTKNRLDSILGDFFTNSSGHPACRQQLRAGTAAAAAIKSKRNSNIIMMKKARQTFKKSDLPKFWRYFPMSTVKM